MNRSLISLTLSLTVFVASTLKPQAEPAGTGHRNGKAHTPRVTHREHAEKARIAQGVRSGELTPDETKALRTQQQTIRTEKKEAKSDGVVSPTERKELRQDVREASRNIYTEKHDGDKRVTVPPPLPVPGTPVAKPQGK